MSGLQNDVNNAKEELESWIKENPYDNDPGDFIFETTDSSVPIYNSDILQYANNNSSLSVDTPELGPAFDGSPTPINIIAANIFEYINNELWIYWNDERDNILDDLKNEITEWIDEYVNDKDDPLDLSEEHDVENYVKYLVKEFYTDIELVQELMDEYIDDKEE